MKKIVFSLISFCLSFATIILILSSSNKNLTVLQSNSPDIEYFYPIPTRSQLDWQNSELVIFFHFGINTFTNKEWGDGTEDPSLFNPGALDVEQWIITAKENGFKYAIITAKHHDGFCLWPSEYTSHSIKNSPYKNGQGDIVKEFMPY